MVTAARLLCVQRWKTIETPIIEEHLVKMTEFAEIAKLTC